MRIGIGIGLTYPLPVGGGSVVTPAVLSDLSITGNSLSIKSTKPGTLHMTLVPDAEAAPTAAQIIAGQKSDGSAAPHHDSEAITAGTNTWNFTIPSLTDGDYKFCFAQEVSGADPSNVLYKVVTIDQTAPVRGTMTVAADGVTLTIAYDETLGGSVATGEFTVEADSVGVAVSAAVISGSNVVLMTDTIFTGEEVTVAFSGTSLTDAAGPPANAAPTFGATLASNDSTQTPAPSISFSDAITDPALTSSDYRYIASVDGAMSTTTRDSYDWFTTGGASDEQSIDTSFSDDMPSGHKTALVAAGSFVLVCDVRKSASGTNFEPSVQVRGLSGTAYLHTEIYDINAGDWRSPPDPFFDDYGSSDVSSAYGVAAGTVYRIWLKWTQDGTNTRVFTLMNDNNRNVDFRNYVVFDAATFSGSIDSEIAGMAP